MDHANRRRSLAKPLLGLAVIAIAGVAVAVPLLARWPDPSQKRAIAQLLEDRVMLEFDDYKNVTSVRINPGTSLAALKQLHALPKVRSLGFPVTGAVDADLIYLRDAPLLEDLILSGNRALTDESLKNLEGLARLKMLYLTDVPIDGSGLESISRLEKLEVLNLSYTLIENDKLVHLSRLASLNVLDLSYTAVSDEGLPHLRNLKNLKMLWVMAAKVTPEGAAELKKSLPDVTVRFGL